jgi:hypothetical protein
MLERFYAIAYAFSESEALPFNPEAWTLNNLALLIFSGICFLLIVVALLIVAFRKISIYRSAKNDGTEDLTKPND